MPGAAGAGEESTFVPGDGYGRACFFADPDSGVTWREINKNRRGPSDLCRFYVFGL
jgi:hypothetical protein